MLKTSGFKVKALSKSFYYTRNYYRKSRMVGFNSIIVFDSETTGLPHLESNNTKITELALIGCEIKHLKISKELPRVLHKLVFCFNPMKMIQPDSTNISGLENELLSNIKPFTVADAEVLSHFITRLPSPVCIIAHNGYKFDFPILQKQLKILNFKLPDDVYCADSLKAFQDIYPNSKQSSFNKTSIAEVTPQKNSSFINSNSPNLGFACISQNIKPKLAKTLFSDKMTAEKKLDTSLSEDISHNSSTLLKVNFPTGYKLSTIYEFLHGECYPLSHRAEEDCKALLSCINKCDNFIEWLGEKAVTFNSIKPLI